jgi:hypothetical protein
MRTVLEVALMGSADCSVTDKGEGKREKAKGQWERKRLRELVYSTAVVVLWVVAGMALLLAVAALGSVRRLSRKVDALNQSYWELRYDYTRLRSQVAVLAPSQAEADADEGPASPPGEPSVSFVPLSTIKKKTPDA